MRWLRRAAVAAEPARAGAHAAREWRIPGSRPLDQLRGDEPGRHWASRPPRHPARLKFIRDSCASDGSWPIDTNLATWNTTLAINALS